MITRDNYQEFFLLYIDDELSAADRLVVEEWVTANPDYREEWESLLQCRVFPEEEMVFRDKKTLLRSTGDKALEENNYADYFLSYIDGELNGKDRLMVEAFIRQHPSKQLELEQLRQTVSTPDTTIVFPDKNSLYKNERHRRVIGLYRLLAGAAAVLLAAVTLLLIHDHPAGEPALVKNTAPTPVSPAPPQVSPAQINKKEPSPVTSATTAALHPKKKTHHPSPVQPPPLAVDRTEAGKQENKISGVAMAPQEHDPADGVKTGGVSQAAGLPLATGSSLTAGSYPAARQTNIPRELSSFATQALQEDNEKRIATASEPASPGKSKLRGLFRRVARNFGKTADRDGEGKREVLISAFQVAVN